MFPVPLLFAVLQLLSQVPGTQRLDATSDATLERTTAAVRTELPEPQRPKFDQALTVLMANYVDKQSDDASEEQFLAGWRATLHGRTAQDVLVSAEAIVRKMIEDHARDLDKTVSRPVPISAAVSGASFACQALLGTSIKPERVDDAELFAVTDTSLLKPEPEISKLLEQRRLDANAAAGTDALAIEIEGNNLKFMTRASVEVGHASAATLAISRNDKSVVVAFALDEKVLGVTVHSLLLNRENGLAVWTKSRSKSLFGDQPDTQAVYLRCR